MKAQSRMQRLVQGLLTSVLAVGLATSAQAQAVRGGMLGNVADDSGGAIPGATVTITEVRTGLVQTTVTNESGNFTFPTLQDGLYRVEVELAGFKKAVRENVQVDVNTTIRADFRLEIGDLSETITVSSEPPALQTDRTDTGRIITGKQVADMPLGFGRNFQGMWATVPGATRPARPHSEFFNPQDSLESKINGQSRLSNNVQIEGVDNNHRTGLLTVLIPSAEALETVSVTTSNFDAEFGRAGGAVTNVTLKSGTNELRGSAFWFHGNDGLVATPYFAQTKPDTTYNQFGFTLGGPIRRNKLFYFGDYQRTNDDLGKVYRFFVPPAEWRGGDFGTATNTTIYDPLTGDGTGNNRVAFDGNVLPANRLSPISRAILDRVPLPNLPGQPIGQPNYEANTVRERRTDSFDVKVNYQATSRDQISPRVSFARPTVFDPSPFGEVGHGGFAGTGIQNTVSAATSWTRTWTNTLVMEIRGGVSWYSNDAIAQGQGINLSEQLGIPGVNLSDYTSGISSMTIQGYSNPVVGFSNSMPWERGETTTNLSTVTTKLIGNHSVKVGGDWRRNRDFLLQTQQFGGPRGTFSFNGSGTSRPIDPATIRNNPANSLASFLLDYPNDVRRDVPIVDEPGSRHHQTFLFVHDKWQASSRVTVDMGLRYEYYTPFVGLQEQGGLSNYDATNNTLRVSGYGDIPANLGVRTRRTNFAPRTGVSWRVTDRDVVRLGYGVTTTPFPDNTYAFNYPTRGNIIQQAANAFQSAGRLSTGFPVQGVVDIPANGIVPVDQPFLRNSGLIMIPEQLYEGMLHSWNVAYQRELPFGFTGEAAYVGNRGQDIIYRVNANAATVLGLDQLGRPLFEPFGRIADVQTFVPGRSDYHSLQVKIDRRFRNGFLMTNSYTLGRARDLANDNGFISTPANRDLSYGLSNFDRRHTWVSSFIAELPFFRDSDNPLRYVLGGWQASGMLSLMSGMPINVTADAALLRAPGNTLYADRVGTPRIIGGFGPGQQYFDPSAYAQPAPLTFGNINRNSSGMRGPGFSALDFSLVKRFMLTGYQFAEFRMDAFNLTNTPNWGMPQSNVASPVFGQVTGAGNQRIIRLAFKYAF